MSVADSDRVDSASSRVPARGEAVISLRDFGFKYRAQAEPTLHEINLQIFPGEKVAIVGASGCGKSTLVRVLNGLVPHYYAGEATGSVRVYGLDPARTTLVEVATKVGTVMQDTSAQFVGLTVADDVAFSLENQGVDSAQMPARVREAARIVGMEEFLSHAPQELSGGQKQRVAMAGVLVNEVEILLFDEPLAMLDPAAGRRTIELIDRLNRDLGKTVVIVEHRLEDVLACPVDRIVLMDRGRIVATLTPDEIVATDLLEQHGIRPPLHVSALKYASVALTPGLHAARGATLELTEAQRQLVRSWVEAATPDTGETSVPARAKDLDPAQTTNETAAQNGNLDPAQTTDETAAQTTVATPPPAIEVREVRASYPTDEGREEVLGGISARIEAGSMIGVVGSNGAGKSTLAKAICGFLPLDSGEIRLGGQDSTRLSVAQRGTKVGFVLQEPGQMLSRTLIREELELGLAARGITGEEARRRCDRALRTCGLWPFRSWPISALSHGQKKRLTIAAILVLQPQVLILDEPTAGQDFAHYTEFMDFLAGLNRAGTTVVLITHDMHLALEYTQRLLVISGGRLLRDDHPSRVLTDEHTTRAADLVRTGLYDLANLCGVADASALVRAFVRTDHQLRGAVRGEDCAVRGEDGGVRG